jgi:hypothetical protein
MSHFVLPLQRCAALPIRDQSLCCTTGRSFPSTLPWCGAQSMIQANHCAFPPSPYICRLPQCCQKGLAQLSSHHPEGVPEAQHRCELAVATLYSASQPSNREQTLRHRCSPPEDEGYLAPQPANVPRRHTARPLGHP